MQRQRFGALPPLIAIVVLCGVLASCGQTVLGGPGTSTQTTTTATATTTMTDSTSRTPPPVGPTTGVVTLSNAQSHFAATDAIQVTIHNGLSASMYAMDHGTACTVLRLQRWANGMWTNTAACPQMTATRFVPVQAGATLVRLAPGESPTKAQPWTPGTYRATLSYMTKPDATEGQPIVVASASFAIG